MECVYTIVCVFVCVTDSSVQKKQTKNTWCKDKCEVQLEPEMLARGETHEARARVQTDEKRYYRSVWSDWGPTASWESPVGIVRPTPPAATELADFVRGVGMVVAGAALALFLAGVLFKNDKAIWVYKKMRGRPPPDPGKSFLKDLNLQHWSPYFTKESLHSPLKTEDIDSVEVISATDDDALCSKAVPLLDKERIDSTSSSFSNPSYSQLCPPPPPPPPESSTGCREEKCKIAQKNEEEERIKEMQIVQLLSKGNGNNNNGEQVQVVSGYEKVEQLHVERLRLQSLDSGVCCGEQASQESLEADGVNVGEGREGEPASRDDGKDAVFQKLFGGNGRSVVGKGSIQVCSDYEQVREQPPGSPELPSADSGVNSGGEEQASHEESLEDMETASARGAARFLFPPPRPAPSLSLSQIVGRAALLSLSRSMETSGDGYMPVRQESG